VISWIAYAAAQSSAVNEHDDTWTYTHHCGWINANHTHDVNDCLPDLQLSKNANQNWSNNSSLLTLGYDAMRTDAMNAKAALAYGAWKCDEQTYIDAENYNTTNNYVPRCADILQTSIGVAASSTPTDDAESICQTSIQQYLMSTAARSALTVTARPSTCSPLVAVPHFVNTLQPRGGDVVSHTTTANGSSCPVKTIGLQRYVYDVVRKTYGTIGHNLPSIQNAWMCDNGGKH
jgi:hypothetical protein